MNPNDLTPHTEVIEPEILDENGQTIFTEESPRSRRPHARTKGDGGGLIGGFFVLAFGFVITLFVAAFTVLIMLPLLLIGKLLGMQVKTFKR